MLIVLGLVSAMLFDTEWLHRAEHVALCALSVLCCLIKLFCTAVFKISFVYLCFQADILVCKYF